MNMIPSFLSVTDAAGRYRLGDGIAEVGSTFLSTRPREVRVTSNDVTTPLSKPMTINPAKISRTAPMAT